MRSWNWRRKRSCGEMVRTGRGRHSRQPHHGMLRRCGVGRYASLAMASSVRPQACTKVRRAVGTYVFSPRPLEPPRVLGVPRAFAPPRPLRGPRWPACPRTYTPCAGRSPLACAGPPLPLPRPLLPRVGAPPPREPRPRSPPRPPRGVDMVATQSVLVVMRVDPGDPIKKRRIRKDPR